jgi:hypothetical protein
MQIIDNVALKLRLPEDLSQKVLDSVESVEYEGDLVIRWDYENMEKFIYLYDKTLPNDLPHIPSPMMRDYSWAGLYAPFEHQKITASFLSLRKRAFCFNEAGTGKTAAAIWAADYLMNMGIIKRVLIVCPLSIMYSAWKDDIFKAAMHRSVAIAHGSKHKRFLAIDSNADFVIINYDGIGVVQTEINDAKFDLIIIDEANAYKNVSTSRWKCMAKLIAPHTRLWLMTGTPAAQSPEDAFGLARLVSPERVPRYVTAWRDLVTYSVSRFKRVPRINSDRAVHAALQPSIRFEKRKCLDLPAVVYQTRDVPLTPQVEHFYDKMKKNLLLEIADEQISAVNASIIVNKLLQISGGSVYSDGRNIVDFDVTPRLNALLEVL